MSSTPRPTLAAGLAGAALALALALAAPASANTTVEVTSIGQLAIVGGTLERQDTFIKGPGVVDGFYEVDENASVPTGETAGTGCTPVTPLVVRCAASAVRTINVVPFGRDDRVTVTGGVPSTVPVSMTGGDGDDILRGADERDFFFADKGQDGADQFYGGGGTDEVDYEHRTFGVTVVLDTHSNDGASGEHDFVAQDIENVTGGNGNDVLIGDDSPNELEGGTGNDDLTGGRSVDKLIGGDGDDTIHDDLDQVADTYDCGAGFDTAFMDLVDFNRGTITDCEKQASSAIDEHPNAAIGLGRRVRIDGRHRLRVPLTCPRRQEHGCSGRLTITRGGRALASRHYTLRPGRHIAFVVHLGSARAGQRLDATARESDPEGRPKTTSVAFRLVRAGR